jgi:hypothetical protein
MTSLIDRIKETLQGAGHEQAQDDESGHAHGHDGRKAPTASGTVAHEHPEGAGHGKKGHKHC